MKLHCPETNSQRHVLVCIYSCKEKIHCPIYYKNYDSIKEYEVPEQYTTKYGEASYPLPSVIQNRLKNQSKKEKEAAKKKLLEEKQQKRADKAKAKREREEEKLQKQKVREYKREQKALKKRPKRTMEEILKANDIMISEIKPKSKRKTKESDAPKEATQTVMKRKSLSERFTKLNFFLED